jgi:hypothetical protein
MIELLNAGLSVDTRLELIVWRLEGMRDQVVHSAALRDGSCR